MSKIIELAREYSALKLPQQKEARKEALRLYLAQVSAKEAS
jgi:hypothetical protein